MPERGDLGEDILVLMYVVRRTYALMDEEPEMARGREPALAMFSAPCSNEWPYACLSGEPLVGSAQTSEFG